MAKHGNKEKISIAIDPDLLEQARAYCDKWELSFHDLVVSALRGYIERDQAETIELIRKLVERL